MSTVLLVTGGVLVLIFGGLTLILRKDFYSSAMQGTGLENRPNPLEYYRMTLDRLFSRDFSVIVLGGWLHYLVLHLLVPVVGLGFFLRTDANFIVVFIGFFLSFQILQRIYPGLSEDAEEDTEGIEHNQGPEPAPGEQSHH